MRRLPAGYTRGMPRYEVADSRSHKFWSIELRGPTFHVSWGRIGSSGQHQLKEFADPVTAQREYDRLVASKLKKGYRLVDGVAPAPLPRMEREQPQQRHV